MVQYGWEGEGRIVGVGGDKKLTMNIISDPKMKNVSVEQCEYVFVILLSAIAGGSIKQVIAREQKTHF